jgi:hypothetical protein
MKENFPLPALIKKIACACRALSLFGLLAIVIPSAVYAYRGASNEVDACNILVGHEFTSVDIIKLSLDVSCLIKPFQALMIPT